MRALMRKPWWLWAAARYLAIVAAAYWVAWLLRFDLSIPADEMAGFYRGLVIVVCAKMLTSLTIGFRFERGWLHQTFPDVMQLLWINLATSILAGVAVFWAIGPAFPRSVYFLDFLVCFLISGGVRFAGRGYREFKTDWANLKGQKGLLIYGAGVAGITLAREIRNNPKLGYRVVGFIDDDLQKTGLNLMGLPVIGTGNQIQRIVDACRKKDQAVREIAVAMPAATGSEIRAAVARGAAAGLATRIVPGLGELISGKVAIGKAKEISVTDLLGRDPVELDLDSVLSSVAGETVLVTGAAGSIGSELCQQLGRLETGRLVALDQAESPLFALEADLRKKYPALDLVVEIGDIRNARQMEQVIETYSVGVIFHAAAYKHVPLMEKQVCEAVRNNVIGTWNLLQATKRSNVSTFVLISSDKAVNPSSIMGLTKRVAELAVSAKRSPLAGVYPTKFLSVRFGNVLVSNGSVVPTFQRQIGSGGPVTVTHPDMQRYFMTVQEAVHLVLRASAMSMGGETFVLEMGKPVQILELARNMITLAGFVPGEDIEIQFTGLRPGEKMFEELALDDEDTIPTSHSRIRVLKGRQVSFHTLVPWIAELQFLLTRSDTDAIVEHLAILVPEYQPGARQISEGSRTPPVLAQSVNAGG